MNIDLEDQELALAREVMEQYLSRLRLEVRHTAHREFRGILHDREGLIESTLAKLVPATPPVRPMKTGIACTGCQAFIPWDGESRHVTCTRCEKIMPARELALRLMTSYSAAVSDTDPPYTFAAQLVMHFAQSGWGTGLHLGRGDWMALGLPLTDAELAERLAQADTSVLHDLSRFFQVISTELMRGAPLPLTEEALLQRLEQALAEAESTDADVYARECLYRIASAPMFGHPRLSDILTGALETERHRKVLSKVVRGALESKTGHGAVGAGTA